MRWPERIARRVVCGWSGHRITPIGHLHYCTRHHGFLRRPWREPSPPPHWTRDHLKVLREAGWRDDSIRRVFPQLAALVLVVFAVGCSSSPTAPTPATVAVVTAPVSDLRWDVIAEGCNVAKPAPMLNDRMADSRTVSGDTIRGLWLMSSTQVTPTRRTDIFTEGVFRRSGTVWALCSWDTLTRDTIQ